MDIFVELKTVDPKQDKFIEIMIQRSGADDPDLMCCEETRMFCDTKWEAQRLINLFPQATVHDPLGIVREADG